MEQNNRRVGTFYEDLAAQYLTSKGYHIADRNYRSGRGEIDLIGVDPDGTLAFIEVKYRKGRSCGLPEEAVNLSKQRQICKVAMRYLVSHKVRSDQPCRFDIIAIEGKGEIRHIADAFPYRQ